MNNLKEQLKQILEKYKHLQLQPLVNELNELIKEKPKRIKLKYTHNQNSFDINHVRHILELEINRHNKEIKRHYEIWNKSKSKNQRKKVIKHESKKNQTIRIANNLRFEVEE